ncbi:MAG TPA: RNA polymerase sigma factor, partial [Bryobacteraceae bacterium]|nr:RNA polymerase sigma factor [Bryobacteraceae bacterium]
MLLLQETQSGLIESCRRGDTDSLRALFDLYKDRVYTIALRYSGNPETAEDIAQDTFVKLFAAIRTFRGESSFDSWLYRLVVNACFDQRRKARRFMPLLDTLVNLVRAPEPLALDCMLTGERDLQVRDAVS